MVLARMASKFEAIDDAQWRVIIGDEWPYPISTVTRSLLPRQNAQMLGRYRRHGT